MKRDKVSSVNKNKPLPKSGTGGKEARTTKSSVQTWEFPKVFPAPFLSVCSFNFILSLAHSFSKDLGCILEISDRLAGESTSLEGTFSRFCWASCGPGGQSRMRL